MGKARHQIGPKQPIVPLDRAPDQLGFSLAQRLGNVAVRGRPPNPGGIALGQAHADEERPLEKMVVVEDGEDMARRARLDDAAMKFLLQFLQFSKGPVQGRRRGAGSAVDLRLELVQPPRNLAEVVHFLLGKLKTQGPGRRHRLQCAPQFDDFVVVDEREAAQIGSGSGDALDDAGPRQPVEGNPHGGPTDLELAGDHALAQPFPRPELAGADGIDDLVRASLVRRF